MSETTREVLDSYQKVFSGDCYKNMEKIVAAVGAACKSLMQVNGNEQIQAWQDALYDPEVLLINLYVRGLNILNKSKLKN